MQTFLPFSPLNYNCNFCRRCCCRRRHLILLKKKKRERKRERKRLIHFSDHRSLTYSRFCKEEIKMLPATHRPNFCLEAYSTRVCGYKPSFLGKLGWGRNERKHVIKTDGVPRAKTTKQLNESLFFCHSLLYSSTLYSFIAVKAVRWCDDEVKIFAGGGPSESSEYNLLFTASLIFVHSTRHSSSVTVIFCQKS